MRFFKIVLKTLIIPITLVLTLLLASKLFEEKIISRALKELNEELSVPVSVQKVSLNLIRNFPNATIEFHNVVIESAKGLNRNHFEGSFANNLVSLEKVHLAFNIKALLGESLELNKIILSKGNINILVDKRGVINYSIFGNSIVKTDSKSIKVLLNLMELNYVEVQFINKYKDSKLILASQKLTAKGQFYKNNYSATTQGKILFKEYSSGNVSFVPKNPSIIKMDLNIIGDTVIINNGWFSTKGIKFKTKGNIVFAEKTKLDLLVFGDNISVSSLMDFVNDNVPFSKEIVGRGTLEIATKIQGELSEKKTPKIKSAFQIVKGGMSHKKSDIQIDDIELKGEYNNYCSPALAISKFSFSSDSSSFNGKLSLHSFKEPFLNIQSDFSINANDIYELFELSQIDSLSGNISGYFSSQGLVPSKFTLAAFSKFNNNGEINISKFNVNIKNTPLYITDANGKVIIHNDKLTVRTKGQVMGIESKFKGSVGNLFAALNGKHEKVIINGDVSFNSVNYDVVKPLFVTEKNSSSNKLNFSVKTKFFIKQFEYGEFVADNLSGNLFYVNSILKIDDCSLNAFNGRIKSDIQLIPSPNNLMIFKSSSTTHNIEINDIFKAFSNFNQNFVTNKNIHGKVTSSINGEILISGGEFVGHSLDLLGHIKITNGELIDFEPAQKLSTFSDINELKHLKFDVLENDILISNGVINIPKMDIFTNAMDISIFGEQQFNGAFVYHIKLLLSDLLGKKKSRLNQQQSEFGIIEDDGLGKTSIYLVATGENGNTTVKFDKKALRQNMKSELKDEKIELKKVLNKEFGWFKKDSIVEEKQPQQKQFEIEWDDD